MAELRFEQVQRFILVKKIFLGDGHFNFLCKWFEREAGEGLEWS